MFHYLAFHGVLSSEDSFYKEFCLIAVMLVQHIARIFKTAA